jgi:hypothetical protein
VEIVGSYSQHFLNPLNQIFKEQVSRDFLKKEGKTGNGNKNSILK